MSGKFVFLSAFLCLGSLIPLFQLASAADITEIRESAIRKLEAQRKIVDEFAFKVTHGDAHEKMNGQTSTRMNYGNVLSERTHFELEQMAAASRLIATLMKSSKDVTSCMDEAMEAAQQENEKFLLDKFYRPFRDSEHKSASQQMDEVLEWSDKKTDRYKEYKKLYDEAMKTIKDSEQPSEITAALNSVTPKGELVVNMTKETMKKIQKIQLNHLKLGDDSLNALRKFVRAKVDKTAEDLEDCFLVQTPYYNLKKILGKVM